MIRTLQVCENNIYVSPPDVITLAAGQAKVIFPDQRKQTNPGFSGELVQRLVQNTGAGDLYLSFGIGTNDAPECNAVDQYHCYLGPAQQRDISNDRGIVCAYSVAGTTVAKEARWRVNSPNDNMPIA
jgi:hypothetical protein